MHISASLFRSFVKKTIQNGSKKRKCLRLQHETGKSLRNMSKCSRGWLSPKVSMVCECTFRVFHQGCSPLYWRTVHPPLLLISVERHFDGFFRAQNGVVHHSESPAKHAFYLNTLEPFRRRKFDVFTLLNVCKHCTKNKNILQIIYFFIFFNIIKNLYYIHVDTYDSDKITSGTECRLVWSSPRELLTMARVRISSRLLKWILQSSYFNQSSWKLGSSLNLCIYLKKYMNILRRNTLLYARVEYYRIQYGWVL